MGNLDEYISICLCRMKTCCHFFWRFIILTKALGKCTANRIGVIYSGTAQHLHSTCTPSTKTKVLGKACHLAFVTTLSFIITLYLLTDVVKLLIDGNDAHCRNMDHNEGKE